MTDLLWEDTVRHETWRGAKGFLVELRNRYVFRGMSNAAWHLETTLDRVAYRPADCEEVLIASFLRAVPLPIDGRPPTDDVVSWLALMRHYGLPSRLLDGTMSPLVAAYFAAEPPPDTDSGCDFAIWAINEGALQRSAEASLGILSGCSAPLSPLELGTNTLFSAAFRSPKRFVALVDANHKSDRQRAQEGLFLCPGDPGWPFWRNLQEIPREHRTQGFMYKVVLPCSARKEVLDDLKGMDLDQEHLLPPLRDAEELCAKLKQLLEGSQKDRGHFQWKVEVLPIHKKYGLLDAALAKR